MSSLAPRDANVRRLLALASVCAPGRRISTQMLAKAFAQGGHAADPVADDAAARDRFDDSLDTLRRACPLECEDHDLRLVVHAMVAAVARHALQCAPSENEHCVARSLVERLRALDTDAGTRLGRLNPQPVAS